MRLVRVLYLVAFPSIATARDLIITYPPREKFDTGKQDVLVHDELLKALYEITSILQQSRKQKHQPNYEAVITKDQEEIANSCVKGVLDDEPSGDGESRGGIRALRLRESDIGSNVEAVQKLRKAFENSEALFEKISGLVTEEFVAAWHDCSTFIVEMFPPSDSHAE